MAEIRKANEQAGECRSGILTKRRYAWHCPTCNELVTARDLPPLVTYIMAHFEKGHTM